MATEQETLRRDVPQFVIFNRHSSILLLGPTGAGKTPLGDLLEKRGLWGKRCHHFDFGANLRHIAGSGDEVSGLTAADREVIGRVLRTGALLENAEFHIAGKILRAFIETRNVRDDDLIVLNGLPRHVDQAGDLDAWIRVGVVAVLACTSACVRDRIALDSGGDRAGRQDDSPEEVERKLKLFHERTLPLLEHYRRQDAKVCEVEVDVGTTPESIWRVLNRWPIERSEKE